MRQIDTPLTTPVRVSVPAGTQRIISFPNEFFGTAVAIQIINESGAGAMTYRYNGESTPLFNIPASSIRSVSNTIVQLLEINADAGGVATMEAQIVLDPRTKSAVPESLV
jgi:hypothetical protein